jgi:tetratricopeptide (TPR) repeat protein
LAAFLGRREGIDKLDEAFSVCEKVLAGSNSRIEAVTQIGVAALRNHMSELDQHSRKNEYFRKVAEWFDAGFKLSPDSKSLTMQRAEFDTLRGETEKVVELYEDFLRMPEVPPLQRALVQNNLAYVLALEQKGEQALQLVKDAIHHLGPTSHLLDTQAMAKIAVGRYADARRDLNLALDEGESASLRFHLAYAQFLDQNRSAAEEEFRQALELGLNPHIMHPAERKMYNRLIRDLGLESLAMNRQRPGVP